MRSTLFRWVLMSGLAGGALIGSSDVSAQPTVRDHRDRRPDDRYDDRGPREAPPPPRAERIGRRKGFVWVTGNWDWRDGRWQWTAGHFERARIGKKFKGNRWEKRGDVFVRIDGTWEDAGAPPPPREERIEVRRGFVFIRGHWDWDDGEWTWVAGRWERERAKQRWREDRWEQRNGEWVLVAGGWENGPAVDDAYPTSAPPTPKQERIAARAGFTWDPGHWEWKNGTWSWLDGHWERERAGGVWTPGHWENRGGRWEWIAGGWGNAPVAAYPTVAPPPPPNDPIPRPGIGQVWIPGHHEWKNGRYEWRTGFFDKDRPGFRFEPGHWDRRGDRFEWSEGQWVDDFPRNGPPAEPYEAPQSRPTQTWVPGFYRWERGRYVWQPGHLETVHIGQRFERGRWEKRGDRWAFTEGRWVADGPTSAPPPLRDERPGQRPGWDFVPGHWEWKNGAWAWAEGRWEREHADQQWVAGHWDNRGGRWEWTDGRWEAFSRWPTQPPPPPVNEPVQTRPGWAWAFGHYRWNRGRYEWQPGRLVEGHAGERHIPHEWVQRGDHYEMQNDRWERAATPPPPPPPPSYGNGPRQAPPPPREERYDPRQGFIWARGHWEWKNGQYDWLPGHWERERAYKKWVDAHWEQRGDTWFFVDGGWQ